MSPISRARITVLTTLAMLAGIGASVPGVAAASGARRAPQVTIKKFGNVTYKTFTDGSGNTVPINFDVYVPQDGKTSHPALIMLHGEGWADGSKTDIAAKAQDYAGLGFTTYAPDYRESCDPLNPAPGDPVQFCGFHFPVPLEDLRDAITFIRANASAHPEWATSPTWVGVWGSSSGGNVAGGLATGWCGHSTPSSTCDTTAGSTKPNAVIAWSPAMNLVDGTGNPVQDGRVPQYLGCNPYSDPPTCTDPDLTAKASPEYNVTSDDAPIFVAGSLKDTITPMDTQVAPMATALQSAGIDTQLYQIAGSCHGVKCKTSDANLESNSANWEHAHLDAQQPTVNIASGPLHPSQLSVATLAFSSRASGVSMTCSLDGAAFVACTSPKSYSSLQQGNHTFSVRATNGSGTGATSTLAWSFVPLAVSITDSGYTPKSPTTVLGGSVQWTNAGPSQHTVTDKSGMGLFDSGTMAVGAKFTQTFVVAGTYNFLDSLNPSLTGSIKNPLVPSATSGPAGSSFTIQWGFALPPSGYTYEVQMKAPGASSFSNWQTGASATQAAVTLSSVGTYQFRAHLKRTSSGKSCAWSPTLSITTS